MRAQTAARTNRSVEESSVHPDGAVRHQYFRHRSGPRCGRDRVRPSRLQSRSRSAILPSRHDRTVAGQERQLVPAADAVARRWFLTAVGVIISFHQPLRRRYVSVFAVYGV